MPSGFYIGPLFIHFYGIIIMLGALAAAFISERRTKSRGLDSELIWDMLPWLLAGGIIGARLWHVFFPSQSMLDQYNGVNPYWSHPLEIFNIRAGGLGIPGAVIGGALALFIYLLVKKSAQLYTKPKSNPVRAWYSFLTWTDIIAPGLILAQAVGRWGNFLNQELYGPPSNLPWAIYIDPQNRLPQYKNVAYYHPLFLYESIWNVLGMAFMIWLDRRFRKFLRPGDVFLVYMIWYPFGRFMLEFMRLDPAPVAGINWNQAFMGAIAILAAVTLIVRHRMAPAQPEVEETAPAPEQDQAAVEDAPQAGTQITNHE